MKWISAGQSALRIVVETGADVTAEGEEETSASICFEKPDGSKGAFKAFILDAEKGVIYYDVKDKTELDLWGVWKFWALIRFSDGRTAVGRPVKVYVYKG